MYNIYTFRCPAKRLKGISYSICNGFLAGIPVCDDKNTLILYCGKCSKFFMAAPTGMNGFWKVSKIDKRDVNMIPVPFQTEGDL